MKHGQKPAEPRMEDVLASIRRAIDEDTHGRAQDTLAGSMAEFRVKFDAPANQETRPRRSYEPVSTAISSPTLGFAGILSGRRGHGELSPAREAGKPREPVPRQPEPAAPHKNDDGHNLHDGHNGAQLDDHVEPLREPYQAPPAVGSGRYLPHPPPAIGGYRQSSTHREGLMSEASSEATQAAFDRLAETLTRRVLGGRPIADVTEDLLRGMLRQWLDDNLPKIVERLVREEIERVVRRPR